MSEREIGQEGSISGGSLDVSGADVLLRASIPPYRLGELLLRIGELALTGKLTLGSDMGRRAILFHSGFPVFTQSTLFAERLGAIGVRHGFFGREDVARALTHARDHENGLGESLIELGYIDPQRLHALLGVQLREVVAAGCGNAPQRARFQAGGAALREVVILRLNPMTAVLNAMASLPAAEQRKLLEAVGARKLSAAPIPTLARKWLADLGYLGDAEHLLQGEPAVSAMRARLLARYRADAEKAFDPAQVSLSFAGTRVMIDPLTKAHVADLVTLTLLMSGAIRFSEPGSARAPRSELLTNTAESLQIALDDAVDKPLAETRASATAGPATAVDEAIAAYLHAKRERSLAVAAAVWGPSAEAGDDGVPEQVLRHYLTLKPEKRPEVVLGVPASAGAEQVMQAYARRAELVASLSQPSSSEHLRCRAAELSQRFDDALDALLPGNGRSSFPPPTHTPEVNAASAESPASAALLPEPSPAPRARSAAREVEPTRTGLRSERPTSARSEALAAKVEALLRAGQWRAVLDALEPRASDPKLPLPFTLQLARAIAQRELRGARRSRRPWWLLALLLGLAVGYFARHYAGAWPSVFQLPF